MPNLSNLAQAQVIVLTAAVSVAALGAQAAEPAPTVAAAGTSATKAGPETINPAKVIPICVPIGLAVNKKDELFVANHDLVGGTTCSGGQVTVYSSTTQPLPARTITKGVVNPASLAFDAAGNLYVADYNQQQVEVYSPTGVQLKAKTLHTDKNYNPGGVQVDKQGNVWVSNRTNNNITIGEIQIFTKAHKVITVTQNLVYPLGIVFQAVNGTAWVGNAESPNDALTTYAPNGRFLNRFGTSGFTPTYLAFAKSGRLYVTDGLHSTIEIFNTSGVQIGSAITTGLAYPYGIAFNSKGDFYVANVGNGGTNNGSSITKYNAAGKLLCTITTGACK